MQECESNDPNYDSPQNDNFFPWEHVFKFSNINNYGVFKLQLITYTFSTQLNIFPIENACTPCSKKQLEGPILGQNEPSPTIH